MHDRDMDVTFHRQLPLPKDIKAEYPLSTELATLKVERDETIRNILDGRDKRMLLVIGPCSADKENSVLEYINRLAKVQEKVNDSIFIVPRVYTNKPRTVGKGYKGILHQPDPEKAPDLLKGIIAVRQMNVRIISETGLSCADEILYPETYMFISDLISYIAIGARSVEDQEHRMIASGVGVPAGMKNPTGGNMNIMLNSILAARSKHNFIYRNWEVSTPGNPYAHAILRGYENEVGRTKPNYHYEDLALLLDLWNEHGMKKPSVLIDCNHSNSGKRYMEQIRIAEDVLHSRRKSTDIKNFVKGLMIESYLEDGCQDEHGHVYGKSITDPCLGWDKTECLINELAEMWE